MHHNWHVNVQQSDPGLRIYGPDRSLDIYIMHIHIAVRMRLGIQVHLCGCYHAVMSHVVHIMRPVCDNLESFAIQVPRVKLTPEK